MNDLLEITTVPIGDASKVKKHLLGYLNRCAVSAKAQTQPVIDTTMAIQRLYVGHRRNVLVPKDAAAALNWYVELKEIPDQIDALEGLFQEILFNSGPLFTATAQGGESQKRVDVLTEVAMDMIDKTGSMDELERAVGYYCKYPVSGLKLERMDKTIYYCEYKDLPLEEADQYLWVASQAGINPVEVVSDYPEKRRFKIESEKKIKQFGFKTIDPRMTMVSDARRRIEHQHTVHEYHYLAAWEMERAGWTDLFELPPANANKRVAPIGQEKPNEQTPQVDFGLYEVTESHGRIPWIQWVTEGIYDEYDLEAFAAEVGATPDQFRNGSLWRFFHLTDQRMFAAESSFNWVRDQIPMWASSFIHSDNEYCGQALAERQSEIEAALNVVFNNWLDNLRMRGNQSYFYSSRMDMSEKEHQRIYKPRQAIPFSGNEDPNKSILFFQPQDLTSSSQAGISFLKGTGKDLGVNPALQGQSNADTATESSINDKRGQVKINAGFRRFTRHTIKKALEALIINIVHVFKVEDYMRIVGERGAIMENHGWNSPEDVLSRVRIEPVATFDQNERRTKANQLNAIANVYGPMLMLPQPPKQMMALLELTMKYSNLTPEEIEPVMDTRGSITELQDEIRALAADPGLPTPEVRMGDNHELALELIHRELRLHPVRRFNQNFADYARSHYLAYQAQLELQAAQMGVPRGPAVQIPNRPEGTDEVRQQGQQVSPEDSGTKTSSGLTGRAVEGISA